MTTLERVLSRVDKTGTCWLWTGRLSGDGYGGTQRTAKGWQSVHKFVYESLRESVPEGLTLDHLCRVRNCCNPDHLEVVTLRENLLRGNTFQAKHAQKTHCPQEHSYDLITKEGGRRCRTCNRDATRRYRERNPYVRKPPQKLCKRGHSLSGTNLYVHRNRRHCKTCRKNWRTNVRQKQAA